jgi:hypothetical protein
MAHKKDAQETSKEPAYKKRFGNIHVAVWPNQKENGEVWYNTSIIRKYREGNEWKDATTYSRDELLLVAKAADVANSWIWDQLTAVQQDQKTEA